MNLDTFYEIVDRIGDPLLLVSPAGVVVGENRYARSTLGPEIRGERIAERTTEPGAFQRYLRLASRSTSPTPGAVTLLEKGRWRCDGSLIDPFGGGDALILLHFRATTSAGTRFLSLNAQVERLNSEIQRREQLEQERASLLASERASREAAEDANRLRDDFLASVSHELRTPLHAIGGWVTLLRESPAEMELQQRGLEVIERNVQAQTALVEDLIDLSLASTGRMKMDVQPVDVEKVVRDAISSAHPAADAKGQRIEVVAQIGRCIINGDPARLLQIVWNLLANATKYTPNGGKIQVVLRRINSHIEIVVSDTGVGIAPDVLPYVFDRFRRGDAGQATRSGGLGLGLSIVRHLAELHGGVVLAESDGIGKGATFIVNLPLPLFSGRSAIVHEDGASDEGLAPLQGLRVLLVEDHEDSRDLLATILRARGATVDACESSERALVAFSAKRPDVMVSDIEMPGDDGFTLMRKIRALEAERGYLRMPAVAVTAHSIGDARLHAMRAGYQAFLVKPVNTVELVELVASLSLGDRGLRDK